MLTVSQVKPEKISAAATARPDRELTGSVRQNWLCQIAGKIRVAVVWRIPVGFEDETGFHLGVQLARKNESMEWERAGFLEEQEQF